MALIRDSERDEIIDDKMTESSLKEIAMRKKSVRNMWIIILTIFLTETYQTLYSIILAIWSNESCYVQDVVWVKSLSTVVERSLQYVWWMYPIIWLLWPQDFNCTCCKKKNKRRNISDALTESRVSTSCNNY